MRANQRKRSAGATGLSLILHVLMLAGMVVGLKPAKPPPEGRPVEVELIRPPLRPPAPTATPDAPQKAAPGPPLRPHRVPAPTGAPPGVALSEPPAPPAPAPPAPEPMRPGALKPSLSGRLGCDDPMTFKLTPEQRQVCANNLAALGRSTRPLDVDIADAKRADYDRNVRCRDAFRQRGIPRSSEAADPGAPSTRGLGPAPSLRACGPGDR